jgi:hypothetical protein
VKNETNEDMIQNKLYYKANGTIHCSKENNSFKKIKELKAVEVNKKKSLFTEQLNN